MNSLPLWTAFLGMALLFSASACRAARRWTLPRTGRLALAATAGACVLLPLPGALAGEYVRGAIGDLSIVTQALLAASVAGYIAGRPLIAQRDLRAVFCVAVMAALFLYPATLGLSGFDPYALGYGSVYFIGVLVALTCAARYLRFDWLAGCLLLAVAGRLVGVLESQNLWDYLLDPLLALYAVFWLLPKPNAQARPRITRSQAP